MVERGVQNWRTAVRLLDHDPRASCEVVDYHRVCAVAPVRWCWVVVGINDRHRHFLAERHRSSASTRTGGGR